ncbi:LysR substrate-binding domain-containing protein [Marinobacterium rhizophilum]|uniref:LysR family transcriptional regulator n=1 Tax=Marinobacterium rhizophilum TaxID=420402 RepID=A0ABY5HCM4_9GAMM|nr:LysR substrate-binding domain-containing protein [Marinobacterium rhizophilum]UTW10095.1 LysR family transcriptional regulator [Marinobacterium rhizophilum]
MSNLKQLLPPLNALRTFEAAARHESFKAAAEELCVTQAAISRQVQTLEEFYSLKLFIRSNRKVELSPEGRGLYLAASAALQHIASASGTLLQRNRPGHISLTTTTSFSQLWLLPRLKQLRSQHPELQLQLISGEGNPDYNEGFDAAVTLGIQEHPLYVCEYLFSEEVFPVCTAEFARQNPQVATLNGLLQVPLLNLSADHWKARLWAPLDWAFWLRQLEMTADLNQTGMSFSHFLMLLDAVHEDIGVGLAWRHLVQRQLEEGKLVRPVRETYQADDRKHYFVCRRDRLDTPGMQTLKHWLLTQTAPLRESAPPEPGHF